MRNFLIFTSILGGLTWQTGLHHPTLEVQKLPLVLTLPSGTLLVEKTDNLLFDLTAEENPQDEKGFAQVHIHIRCHSAWSLLQDNKFLQSGIGPTDVVISLKAPNGHETTRFSVLGVF